jgi:hypothetical protein|tara:strand:+ start:1010 stop:1462 length:453 start_codon:yes stop_codon:yes gene_type:complete
MPEYHVGQVLFMLAGTDHGVIPVRICEEIHRKALDGETIDYMVNVPGRDKPINLRRTKARLFTNESALRAHMLGNAEKAINELIHKAGRIAQKYFEYQESSPTDSTTSYGEHEAEIPDNTPGSNVIDLGDGTVARIQLPTDLQDLVGEIP